MVKGFSKMYNLSFFGQIFFCKHFYYKTGFCDKKINFCKFANFFQDSKSRAQELSNDVSFVIFGHKKWDLEGGGVKLTPPSVSWFSSTPAGIGLTTFQYLTKLIRGQNFKKRSVNQPPFPLWFNIRYIFIFLTPKI